MSKARYIFRYAGPSETQKGGLTQHKDADAIAGALRLDRDEHKYSITHFLDDVKSYMVPPERFELSILAALVSKTSVYTVPPERHGTRPGTRTQTAQGLKLLPLPLG